MVGVAGALVGQQRPLLLRLGKSLEPIPVIQDPRLKALADVALDAARSAGAAYVDVRLTHTWRRQFSPPRVGDIEEMAVGVRALVDGYWGFASGPLWSRDEMARLGSEAVRQGKANVVDGPREVNLAPVDAVRNGHWEMPVARDPFEVSPFEILDFMNGMVALFQHPVVASSEGGSAAPDSNDATFWKQERLLATTDGSYCSQRLYRSAGDFAVSLTLPKFGTAGRRLYCLTPAGLGWELYSAPSIPQVREHGLYEEILRTVDVLKAILMLPVKPVEVGRYDAVFDAVGIQNIAAATLGQATQLDRALGFEANESGTSYLNDPYRMLGTYQAGARLLTLTGSRSVPGGAATVRWDDEGVEPDTCMLVKDGVLQDFQTTRESAGWLKGHYSSAGHPERSHGFAGAPSAIDPPLQRTPNLGVSPGAADQDYASLLAQISDGIAIENASADMDFQDATGLGGGWVFEVKRGKKSARIAGAGFLFRSTEFWKALQALGGEASVQRYGHWDSKGAPAQEHAFSVAAPPALVKQVSLISPERKA